VQHPSGYCHTLVYMQFSRDIKGSDNAVSAFLDASSSHTRPPPHHADPDGKMINGWPQQADLLVAMHTMRPLDARRRKIMWRGRASDEPRDEVRSVCYVQCEQRADFG
jgi:hypothetical protein